jgi:hypothetical protein
MTEAVTFEQAKAFLEDATRNWSGLLKLNRGDISDTAQALARFTAEALRARDEKIAELERERDNLSELVRGWHYLAVGPDEMGDYHTQRKLIELSEPYASPALKTLKEKNDDA